LGPAIVRLIASLDGRQISDGWIAHCPAHDDRRPSLSVRVVGDRVLVKCHTGCSQAAVIAALRDRGLWPGQARQQRRDAPLHLAADTSGRHIAIARHLWERAVPAGGTLVETYLRSRGIEIIPERVLRYHPRLRHPCGTAWPAMVALVTRGDGVATAIHRTFIARDGSAKAPVDPNKMMLGPCHGGAVRLASLADELMVGEGIETCLAAMQTTGRPAWAALSASGLRAVDLPPQVRNVIVLADGDDAGEAAARNAARRWTAEGRSVRIVRAPTGLDFADLAPQRAVQIIG